MHTNVLTCHNNFFNRLRALLELSVIAMEKYNISFSLTTAIVNYSYSKQQPTTGGRLHT